MLLEGQSRKLSSKTIEFYSCRFKFLVKVLGDREVRRVTVHDLRLALASSPPKSARHNYIGIKRLFGFLVAEEILRKDPSQKLACPQVVKTVVEPFTYEQMVAMLNACRRSPGWTGVRNTAILCTLLGTGLRRAELCNLRDEDVRIDEGALKVKGKGNKERIVPVPFKLRKILARYIFERQGTRIYGRTDCPYFFRDRRGEQLQPQALTRIVHRLGCKIGIKAWTHRTRHSFATYFMDNQGADVLILKEICGWSSLDMALRYVKPTLRKLQESQEAFSPLNRL